MSEKIEHTKDLCPFGATIESLQTDLTEIKTALVGDAKGKVGLATKVNLTWNFIIIIVFLLVFQVAPALGHILGFLK